jgi:hypothetical protein
MEQSDCISAPLSERLSCVENIEQLRRLLAEYDRTFSTVRIFKEAFRRMEGGASLKRIDRLMDRLVVQALRGGQRSAIVSTTSVIIGPLASVTKCEYSFGALLEKAMREDGPESAPILEALCFAVGHQGEMGVFTNCVRRLICDPHWRLIVFNSQLRYFCDLQSVAHNIGRHLRDRKEHVRAIDVAGAIGVFGSLAAERDTQDLSENIRDGILLSLRELAIERTLITQVDTLMVRSSKWHRMVID